MEKLNELLAWCEQELRMLKGSYDPWAPLSSNYNDTIDVKKDLMEDVIHKIKELIAK